MKVQREKIYYTKDILKLEIAEELGLDQKIRQGGWGELTSVESGKIGGIMTRKMRANHWG